MTRAVRRARRTALARDLWFRRWGSLREKEGFGLIERPQYAYGVLRAADVARYFGLDAVTVCEFGVASGDGLVNLVEVAELVTRETGIEFECSARHRRRPPVQGSRTLVRTHFPVSRMGLSRGRVVGPSRLGRLARQSMRS